MKRICALLFLAVCLPLSFLSQISCDNAVWSAPTNYTNGSPNDSIYYICTGSTAQLIASPPSGIPGWHFMWDRFVPVSSSWVPYAEDNNVPVSVQNASSGGYRVKIFDSSNVLVGVFIAWVCRVTTNPTVNISTLPAGCGNVQLSAVLFNSNITPYYNPPLEIGLVPSLIIDANTEISICFSGTHPWVSDLGFYVVGPASCGSPSVALMVNPGSLGQESSCNPGNDIANLCFSTESQNNIDVCAGAPFTLQGTYGSYGPDSTPINWSLLYGCDAANAGWAVQVYDCNSGDFGVLTDATLTFSGLNNLGEPVSISYTTPTNYNSAINDNACIAEEATIFQVGNDPVSAIPLPHDIHYQWSADPPFFIPNNTSSLNITLSPGPQVDTYFTLQITGNNPGAACGGTDMDIEFFDFIEPSSAVITATAPFYCSEQDAFNLQSDQIGGVWSGTGIIDPTLGTFDPQVSGEGVWTVSFDPNSPCVSTGTIEIEVINQPIAAIEPVASFCNTDDAFDLIVNYPGGEFSGPGIIDAQAGTIDPGSMPEGNSTITYTVDGNCPVVATTVMNVGYQPELILDAPENQLCILAEPIQLSANASGGEWSGSGISNATLGLFDPQLSGVGVFDILYTYSGVCSDEASLQIEVIDSNVVIMPVDVLCITSDAVYLQASVSGGVWSGDGIVNANTGLFDPQELDAAGTYTISYESNNACDAMGTLEIAVEGISQMNISVPFSICLNEAPLILTCNIEGGVWSGDGITDTETGLFDPAIAGIGSAIVTYSIDGICSVSVSSSIEVASVPEVVACADSSICPNGNMELFATGASDYSWNPDAQLSEPDVQNPIASPENTTTYIVTGTNPFGCSATDEVVVNVYEEPAVEVNGPFVLCAGESVQLMAGGLENYQWTGDGLSASNIQNPIAQPQMDESYIVEGADVNGCQASASIQVTVVNPQVEFTASSVEGNSPLAVVFNNGSVGDEFIWDFGNGNVSTTTDVSFSPTEIFTGEETYTVTLTSILDGCPVSQSIQIYSHFYSEIKTIPNVVTLGGDHQNDQFRIISANLRQLQIEIFDRWGKQVGTLDHPADLWDPKEFGTGTYYYVLSAEGYDNIQYSHSGFITVLE